MQATVHRFDPDTKAGAVVTDAGLVVPFGADAFATSKLRHLRLGQRLTVVVEGEDGDAVVVGMRLEGVAATPGRPSRP